MTYGSDFVPWNVSNLNCFKHWIEWQNNNSKKNRTKPNKTEQRKGKRNIVWFLIKIAHFPLLVATNGCCCYRYCQFCDISWLFFFCAISCIFLKYYSKDIYLRFSQEILDFKSKHYCENERPSANRIRLDTMIVSSPKEIIFDFTQNL